jgi:dienelactone hydrolase
MIANLRLVRTGLIASVFGCFFQGAAAAPGVEAFGSLPEFADASLSPDGTHIAILRPMKDGTAVFVYDTANFGAPPHPFGIPDSVADFCIWPNNARVVCSFRKNLKQRYSRDIHQWSRVISMNADGSNPVVLLHDEPFLKYNLGNSIVDMPPEEPNHVYMTGWETNAMMHGDPFQYFDEMYLNLFRVNVTNGLAEMVLHGTTNEIEIFMDGHGHPIGRVDQDSGIRNHVFLGTREVGDFDATGGAPIEFEGLTADDNPSLAVEYAGDTGTTGLYTWQSPGGVGRALFADPQYDVDEVVTDRSGTRVTGVRFADDRMRTHYFDPAMQKIQNQLEAALPGQSIRILSQDASGAAYAVQADGPRNPPVLAIFRPATRQLSITLDAYPLLQSADLGEMKPYPYKSRDGLDIHAYLTLPPGRDPHKLPTVILAHGGPESRDLLHFDWMAQFLASRGYAVLQPNFRGSSGYGARFVRAGDGEWANKVQFDVQDGVKKLIDDGIADAKRICIVGASYGGYMALAGATFSPDLYACAVSYAGISDIPRILYTGTRFKSEAITVWEKRIGASRTDTDKLYPQSPAKHADAVKIPILLIHSTKDVTVPIEQSEIEEAALKRFGKPVEFVKLDGDDHYLSFSGTRIRMLTEVEKFLGAHIGG